MTATKGDQRRTALLAALEEHLCDGSSLDAINIADISRRAGVTRSAFYFYFENKAAAVAALYEEMYADGFDAAAVLGGDGTVRDRISMAIRAIVAGWGQRTHLYRAILDARAVSPAVRDQWDAFQASYADVVAELIVAERESGAAPEGPDARAVATALLDLNDRTLARVVHAGDGLDLDGHLDAVVHVWLASIYGRTT
ncbi:TetR family transcriptional regulator [Nocardioides sp. LMS-CY]|uniref:AcrR family transcriptional regulator n=1 Tax=Nocardioides soli TaxID=1036020 RepID=A0A7W4W0P4_9ACTN|nr:TetR/AcrR family transcriptional regulator [Nocardioides sp. LMS-CY]MBB3045220.1 AcrR family transcriptional regulator [Nocardioides soli]QWF21882.1 TetR family transcriptional regulator [Nocardioides sp. LMS-CY]